MTSDVKRGCDCEIFEGWAVGCGGDGIWLGESLHGEDDLDPWGLLGAFVDDKWL